jgi:hypothetical protein
MDPIKDFVKAKRPCAEGFRWFLRHHHDGSDYQPLLDVLMRARTKPERLMSGWRADSC